MEVLTLDMVDTADTVDMDVPMAEIKDIMVTRTIDSILIKALVKVLQVKNFLDIIQPIITDTINDKNS